MDLRSVAVDDTAFLHLKGPDDRPLMDGNKPVGIWLFSPGTRQFAKAEAERATRMVKVLKDKGSKDMAPEELAAENAAYLASCTKAMECIERDDLQGEDLFRAVYADRSHGFVAEQAARFIGNWANFSKGLRKS